MTAGLHAVNLANKILDLLSGSNITAPANCYVKLHTGDPGSAGTSNASAETTRKAVTWAAASAGSKAANGTLPSWASWSAGSETITHISLWDASTSGNFLWSGALSGSVAVVNGNTLSLTSLSAGITPIAA